MLSVLGMALITDNIPWQMHASTAFIFVVRIENKGSSLVVCISQCKTLAFDPNEVVFLVKVIFLL